MTLQSFESSFSATSPTLLHLVAAGDAQAWQRFVSLYGPLVFYWAKKQGLSEQDAADVMQDVFASVVRSIRRFEVRESGSFRAWLWVMTRNHLASLFRKRSQQAQAIGGTAAWQQLAAVADSLPDDPDEFTEQHQMAALHRRGLEIVKAEFEDRTWDIFSRVVMDGSATKDVADEFEITANAVRQVKSRVLRRLRQVMGETLDGL